MFSKYCFIRHLVCLSTLTLAGLLATAQSVSPVVSEYTDHAASSFEVTNNSAAPAIVVMEPKSFSIRPDGDGVYRDLDPSIHLSLSATSLRLEPHETARVFYKVTADSVPAWLCIYASFSPVKKSPGVNLRILIPHTIYLYQHQPLAESAIEVGTVQYDLERHVLLCDLLNNSDAAGRALGIEVTGKHGFATVGGFPLLPHQRRVVKIKWDSDGTPQKIAVQFEHFALKRPVAETTFDSPAE